MTLIALVGLVGCSNVFGPGAFNPGNGKSASGTGYVQLQFGTASGRTVLPDLAFDYYKLTFTKGDVSKEITDEDGIDLTDPIELDVGTWKLDVIIYADEDKESYIALAEVEVQIRKGQTDSVKVALNFVPIPDGTGTFAWNITYPAGAEGKVLMLVNLLDDTVVELDDPDIEAGSELVFSGYYLATASAEMPQKKKAVWFDVVQVYPEATTTLTVAADDFSISSALVFPLVIDNFILPQGATFGSYYARWSNSAPATFEIRTEDGRPYLNADIEPYNNQNNNGLYGSWYGTNTANDLDIDISDYLYDYIAVVLDLTIIPSPYTYSFELTVNKTADEAGVVYSAPVTNVRSNVNIKHAIPLSQFTNEDGDFLTDLSEITINGWGVRCAVRAGRTETKVFGIALKEVQTRTITKGAVDGPTGNDFTLPAATTVPVGNFVPVNLTIAPANDFLGLKFSSDLNIVQGSTSTTVKYFIMPDANITIDAEFYRVPEPTMWVIEDFVDASKRGGSGWFGDWCNTTFGYWGINAPTSWSSTTQSGPHWIATNGGDAIAGTNYLAIQPLNRWIMQIEANTGLAVGRNLPAAMDISQKDTIRLLLRRSGAIELELGLFNGGQPLAGYNGATDGTGVIDAERSGSGYWVAIPANITTTSIADSSWDFLEIPLSSFTSQGFDAGLLTGYGIRVISYSAANDTIHNRPRFYLDSIVAFAQADKKTIITVDPAGGKISVPENYATAVAGQIIPVTATPDASYVFDGLITTPVAANADPALVNATIPLAIIMPDANLTITGSFRTP